MENRYYDMAIVFDKEEEKRKGLIKELSEIIQNRQGQIEAIDEWGIRKLAYPIRKKNEGFYLLLRFTAPPDVISSITDVVRTSEQVMRFLIIKRKEPLLVEEEKEEVKEK